MSGETFQGLTEDQLAAMIGSHMGTVPAPLLDAGEPVEQTNDQIAAGFAGAGPGLPPAGAPPSPVTAWSNPQSDVNRASVAANPNVSPNDRANARYGGTVVTNPALGPQVRPPMAPPPEPSAPPIVYADKAATPTTASSGKYVNPYAGYLKSGQGELDALGELGTAQQYQEEDRAVAAMKRSEELERQKAETAQRAQEHDQEIARQMASLDQMSRDAASQKIDPDRWYHSQNTGSKIMWGLAAALGGFAQGWTHGAVGNAGLDAMKEHVNNDIAAQKEEIEAKKGRVGDMRGVLAETYRRFGNMDQAVSAAQILSLQKIAADADVMAAQSNSATTAANNKVLQARFKSEMALQYAQFQAHAAGAGVMTPKQKVELEKIQLENEALRQKNAGGGAGSMGSGPAPKSTNFLSHPLNYIENKFGIQGTEGYKAGLEQQASNIPVHTYAHKVGGIRTPEGQREVYDPVLIQPNDSLDTIRFKQELRAEMAKQGGGGGASEESETPEGFDKIGDTDK